MITAYVVDDETAALKTMKSYIDRTPGLSCLSYESDPLKAKVWFEQNMLSLPDIVFLDIEMKKLKGLILAAIVKRKTRIIFTTAYAEFAFVSYDFNAVDYLLKPFDYERFCLSLEKCALVNLAFSKSDDEPEGNLVVKDSGNKITTLKTASIIHINAAGNYVRIFLDDNTSFMPIITLKKVNELLAPSGFLQIHKSHIVNLNKVKSYSLNILELENGLTFNIGRKFKKNLLEEMEKINLARLNFKR